MVQQLVKNIFIATAIIVLCGCSQPEESGLPEPVNKGSQDNQAGVIAAIDRLIDQFYSGVYGEKEIIEKLREVIPRPNDFPEYPIEFIVPWGEGSSADNYARNLGYDASLIMEQNIFYNNLPGGGGEVGLTYLLKAPPDGYTLYAASVDQSINEVMGRQSHPFSKNVDFIIRSQDAVEAYWVVYDSPFRNMGDALDFAVDNPGRLKICGDDSSGDGQFKVLSLARELGTEVEYSACDGAAERMEKLLERETDLLLESVGVAEDYYKNRAIRPLAYSGNVVFSDIDPNISCIGDLGYSVPSSRWKGIVTVNGVDKHIIDYLHNCFYAASKLPYYQTYKNEFINYFYDAYLNPIDFKTYVFEEVYLLDQLAEELK